MLDAKDRAALRVLGGYLLLGLVALLFVLVVAAFLGLAIRIVTVIA